MILRRGVEQFGSSSGSQPEGRWFKSNPATNSEVPAGPLPFWGQSLLLALSMSLIIPYVDQPSIVDGKKKALMVGCYASRKPVVTRSTRPSLVRVGGMDDLQSSYGAVK